MTASRTLDDLLGYADPVPAARRHLLLRGSTTSTANVQQPGSG